MSNIDFKNVVDVSCFVYTPNIGDIIELISGKFACSYFFF